MLAAMYAAIQTFDGRYAQAGMIREQMNEQRVEILELRKDALERERYSIVIKPSKTVFEKQRLADVERTIQSIDSKIKATK